MRRSHDLGEVLRNMRIFFGWRYIVCGEIVDQAILENGKDFGEPGVVQSTGERGRARNGKG